MQRQIDKKENLLFNYFIEDDKEGVKVNSFKINSNYTF